MGDELPFINFSNSKHIDRTTLSRIRSHAQQKVQDEKWSRKIGKERDGEGSSSSKVIVPRLPERQCLKLVFEKRGKDGKKKTAVVKAAKAKKRKKSVAEEQAELLRTACQSLVVSPVDRRDPFDAFPVSVNAEFMDLLEGYYGSWRWNDSKATMLQATIQSPVLTQSCLAMAYHIWRRDEYRTMVHENKTLELISSGITQLNSVKAEDRQDTLCALIWAIIRLATIKVNQGQMETSLNHLNALVLVSPTLKEWSGHKFALHLQSAIASLLLANFTQSGKVLPSLHSPYGTVQTSAVLDVKTHGYQVPSDAVMLDPIIKCMLDPAIMDAVMALTALYNTCEKTPTSQQSLPHMHTGRQAFEGVRIALRLAQLGPNVSNADSHADGPWHIQLQDSVRLTAILFTWSFARKVSSRNEALSSLQNQLHALLSPRQISRILCGGRQYTAFADLVLWMLIVCGSTTTNRRHMLHYAEMIRDFIPEARQMTVKDLRRLGERVPWIDVECNVPMEEFWNLVTCEDLNVMGEFKGENGGDEGPLLVGFVRHHKQPPRQGGRNSGT